MFGGVKVELPTSGNYEIYTYHSSWVTSEKLHGEIVVKNGKERIIVSKNVSFSQRMALVRVCTSW